MDNIINNNFLRVRLTSLLVITVVLMFFVFCPISARAMAPGTLVYRTVEDGKMYGYSGDPLLEIENGVLKSINPGHVGIYIGQEDGEDYIVEALATGIVKTKAKNFVNEAAGEKLIGARLPVVASALDRLRAVKLAKSLAESNLAYDFDFRSQKGPGSGEWTCVGLVEKVYESAGINNPLDLSSLEYNSSNYHIDITLDGFDNYSSVNQAGDCFSTQVEFSKIARRTNLILPLPEIVGYNAGREYQGERYIFLPYTQYLQPSLKDELIDIELISSFSSEDIRGKTPVAALLLRWSLVNNPKSSVGIVMDKAVGAVNNLLAKVFGSSPESGVVLTDNGSKANAQNNQIETSGTKVVINQAQTEAKNVISQKSQADSGSIVKSTVQQGVARTGGSPATSQGITISNNLQDKTSNQVATSGASQVSAPSSLGASAVSSLVKIAVSSSSQAVASNQLIKSADAKTNTVTTSPPARAVYSPSGLSISKIITGIKPPSSSSNNSAASNNNSNNSPENSSKITPTALITKIYATDNNDFIEIYNPLDYGFDLAEAGIRLERSKTAEDPSLVMRIGNAADGTYPGGTFIEAKGYYLIVRDDASSYYLSKADAIATRSEFSWTGSGYIIYLGKGSISSSADEDIIDAVGFGASKYYQGSGPAPLIEDNYFLDRVANDGDNRTDFILKIIADPDIVWEDGPPDSSTGGSSDDNQSGGQGNDNQNGDTPGDNQNGDTPGDDQGDNPGDTPGDDNQDDDNSTEPDEDIEPSDEPSDFQAFVFPDPIVSPGISHLWHFNECYGPYRYSVGRFDCSVELYTIYPKFTPELDSSIDFNQATISFYYRNSWHTNYSSRLTFQLKNAQGQAINILLEPGLFQAEGLPNSAWRYFGAPISDDNNWHHFALVVNRPQNYWAVYFDGVEKYRQLFVETLPNNFSFLEFQSGIGSIALDEVTIWNRALTLTEIANHWYYPAPFAPVEPRPEQKPAELKYFWNFNEGHEFINEGGGRLAVDSVSGLTLNLPENIWVWRGSENTGILNRWEQNLAVNFPEPLARKDLSLGFWWRSQFYPREGRSHVFLQYNGGSKFGLAPDQYRRSFYFNDQYGVFSEGNGIDLPYDEDWHHFVMTYDSYRYQLKLYIDGEEKRTMPFFWIKEEELPYGLEIKSQLNSVELDDLGIWEGTLTPLQIREIYQNSLDSI